MKIRCIIGSAAFAASLTCSGAWAWDQDPFRAIFRAQDTIISGAGDARDVNAATHIIDPWPRYVGNRRIPANGDRLSRAVERYRQGSYRPPAPPIFPLFGGAIRDYRGGGGCRWRWGAGGRWWRLAAAVGRLAVDAEASHLRPGSILDDERGTRLRTLLRFSFLGGLLGFGNITSRLDHDHTGEDFSSSGPERASIRSNANLFFYRRHRVQRVKGVGKPNQKHRAEFA